MLGIGEIIFLACLVLVIFNIRRLPEIGSSLRRMVTGFKEGISDEEKRKIRDVKDYKDDPKP